MYEAMFYSKPFKPQRPKPRSDRKNHTGAQGRWQEFIALSSGMAKFCQAARRNYEAGIRKFDLSQEYWEE
jgi:hypothetical protein